MYGREKTNIAVIIAAGLFMLDVVLGLTYSGLSVVIHNRKLDGSMNATDAAIVLQYAAAVGAEQQDVKITDFF